VDALSACVTLPARAFCDLLSQLAMPPLAGMAHAALGTAPPDGTAHACSVDGLHPSDLAWARSAFPSGGFATLAKQAITYTGAYTQVPTDSFPGQLALVTGAPRGASQQCRPLVLRFAYRSGSSVRC
jgi:Type I phosphodiesterase / nucleotide pyrophosphatase